MKPDTLKPVCHVLAVLLFFCDVSTGGTGDVGPFFHLLSGVQDADSALQSCRALGSGWSLPYQSSLEDHVTLTKEIRKLHLTQVWLALRKKDFHDWTLVDGTTFDNKSQILEPAHEQGQSGYGLLVPRDCQIYPYSGTKSCSYGKNSCFRSVCQRKHCKCPQDDSSLCFEVGGSCLFPTEPHGNWFESRSWCLSRGQDLAALNWTQTMELCKLLDGNPITAGYKHWVGVRNQYWVGTDNNGESKEQVVSSWEEHNGSAQGSCAVLHHTETSDSWKIVACKSKQTTLCQRYPSTYYSEPTNPVAHPVTDPLIGGSSTQAPSEKPAGNGSNGWMIVSIILLVLVIAGGLTFLLLHLHKKRNQGVLNERTPEEAETALTTS